MSARYDLVPQGISAELIAEKWGITREENDAFAGRVAPARRARATEEGRFENEIVPGRGHHRRRHDGVHARRRHPTRVDGGDARPAQAAFEPDGGVITAGNSSQITDGASAALIMSEERARALGLRPRARFHTFALAGADPVLMLTAPIPATTKVLERAGLTLDDIDLIEINEAFAPVVLAWAQEHQPRHGSA